MPRPFLPRLALVLTLLTVSVRAVPTNITIDDSNDAYFTWTEDPDSPPVLIPWAAITPTTPCDYCSAQPQTTDIYNKTWHDGGNNSAGSFTFQGSAVWIYGIDLDNPANITFSLDGAPAGFHYYAGSEQFVFQSLFFNAASLTGNVNHSVSWVLHETKTNGSTGLFDYAIFTTAESSAAPSGTGVPNNSKTKSNVGAIVGGVIGGLALLALIGGAAILFVRRRRSGRAAEGEGERERKPRPQPRLGAVDPFVAPAAAPAHTTATAPSLLSTPTSGSDSKMLDLAWTHPFPAPASTVSPTQTTITPLQSSTDLSSVPALPSTASVPSVPTPTTTTTHTPSNTAPSERERVLETRLAQLEAHVNEHILMQQPPPYVPPPEREGGGGGV
ncbi:hypothetical protein B0H11DRAFT_2006804 [Mycena galericulata]|nr:hypothetical protein B0H11DRAFT_2006804 [Mycena galericulata]